MTSKAALNYIKHWVEYITRLDYVDPIVRGEVKELLYNAYHKTTSEFDIIERDLEILEIIKKKVVDIGWVITFNNQIEYNKRVKTWSSNSNGYFLTEEEFNKLKEWLENE